MQSNSFDPAVLQQFGVVGVILGILVLVVTLFWLVFPITVYQQLKRTNRLLEENAKLLQQIEQHTVSLEYRPQTPGSTIRPPGAA